MLLRVTISKTTEEAVARRSPKHFQYSLSIKDSLKVELKEKVQQRKLSVESKSELINMYN